MEAEKEVEELKKKYVRGVDEMPAGTFQENEDGTWSEAVPIGWMEEHNKWQRFLFWLSRTPHCSDEAHRRLIARG